MHFMCSYFLQKIKDVGIACHSYSMRTSQKAMKLAEMPLYPASLSPIPSLNSTFLNKLSSVSLPHIPMKTAVTYTLTMTYNLTK